MTTPFYCGARRMPASEVSFASAYDEEVGAFSPPSCAGENLTCQLLIAGRAVIARASRRALGPFCICMWSAHQRGS
jgi:hypothetical protein